MSLSRRHFLTLLSASTALSLGGCVTEPVKAPYRGKKVVVIGGGFAGATAAKYIKRLDPATEVTLIEEQLSYTTGPANNWVLGGLRSLHSITFGYKTLQEKHGIQLVQSTALKIDPVQKKVHLKNGVILPYERLILAPGVEIRWDSIDGYTPQTTHTMPHAWKSGAQISLLRGQLLDMEDGGTVIISVPPMPYGCPPAPYERASLIAHYLQRFKPKSKLLIFDAQDNFAQQNLFIQGWKKLYGFGRENALIERIGGDQGGEVTGVNPTQRSVITDSGEHKGDVLNIIPAQQAGFIVRDTQLTDVTGWCPVNPLSWESTEIPHIHVIGDASLATPMPKSAFAANSQAKSCAAAIVAALNQRVFDGPSWVNTCYSLLNPHYGISTTMIYKYHGEQIAQIAGAGGQTPSDGNHQLEAVYADSWYNNITQDVFG